MLVVIGLGLPGSRTAAEAEVAEAAGDDEAQEPGRRRAGDGREPEERSRRRRAPRRGEDEPQLPPGTEVPRPAMPARAFARRAAAVPAGVRAGWPRRGGPPGAEDPYAGEEAQQGGVPDPGGDLFPGEASRPGGRGYPGPLVPEQAAPAGRGRRAAADLTSETIAYRAPNGDTTGRHSHRSGHDQAPAAELGTPQQDYATPTAAPGRVMLARATTPGPDTRPEPGPIRRGRATMPGCQPAVARTRRADVASVPAGRGVIKGQAPGVTIPAGTAPWAAGAPPGLPGAGPGDEPQADREARERFSLPIRRGAAGQDRAGRFASCGAAQRRPGPSPPRMAPARTTAAVARPAATRARAIRVAYPTGSYQGGRRAASRAAIRAVLTRAAPTRAAGRQAAPPAGAMTPQVIRVARTPPARIGPRAATRAARIRAVPIPQGSTRAAGRRQAVPAAVTTM